MSLLLVNVQSIHETPFFVLNSYWETVENAVRDLITVSVWPNSEWNPIMSVAQEPTSHVRKSSVSCTSSAWQSSCFNDFGSSFLDSWNESFSIPLFSNQIQSRLSFDGSPSKIRRHSWWMVSPNNNLCDISNSWASFFSNLPNSPIVIKSGHGSEVSLR